MGLTQWTAAVYLLAGLLAAGGVVLAREHLRTGSVWVLAGGVALHTLDFFFMHDDPPPLTDLVTAVSWMSWIGTTSFLALALFVRRLAGLVMLVGPLAFLGIFFAALPLPEVAAATGGSASWSHLHVLLASAGLALLGLAGLAGALLIVADRRLKAKRPLASGARLPSVESLDHVIALSLAVGFPLLTLGVVTGSLWLRSMRGEYWSGSAHEIWCAVAWAIYVVLAVLRFGTGQGARATALSAIGGFAFLLVAVIGVGLVR